MSKPGTFELGSVDSTDSGAVDVTGDRRSASPDSGTENAAYISSRDTIDSTAVIIDDKPHSSGKYDTTEINLEGDDLSDDEEENCFTKCVKTTTSGLKDWYDRNADPVWVVIEVILLLLWIAYFIGAMYYNFRYGYDSTNEPAIRLIAINSIAIFCVIYWFVKKNYGRAIWKNCLGPAFNSISNFTERHWHILKWIAAILLLAALLLVLIVDVGMKEPSNLISLLGMVTYITLFFIFSRHPSKVNWRPVIWGLLLQFIFAYLILRTCVGYLIFKWCGDRIQEFLTHTDAGSKFVFGDLYENHFFAFKVLPVVVFFSTFISMLYYLGWMQLIIEKVAWVMQVCMGTTAGESLNAAGNIFVGQTEAPLMIKPMLGNMTKSELHAIMTGGFATIAGSVLATYILFGVPANHLLSASVMSAPAALAMSKLFYPETKKSRTTVKEIATMGKATERNLIEAASAGASTSIKLVANIAANLIAFLALLQFINETLKWFGARVGLGPPNYPDFTFQFICSYVLWPFAWVMGVPNGDCRQVATLIGVKTFTNEFIAYSDLAKLIQNRELISDWFQNYGNNDTIYYNPDSNCYILSNGTYTSEDCIQKISERAEVIAIYALCGFANLGSIGIMLGGLGALAPERKKDIAQVVFRAMIAGNVACFMTACIAGLLTVPDALETSTCGL